MQQFWYNREFIKDVRSVVGGRGSLDRDVRTFCCKKHQIYSKLWCFHTDKQGRQCLRTERGEGSVFLILCKVFYEQGENITNTAFFKPLLYLFTEIPIPKTTNLRLYHSFLPNDIRGLALINKATWRLALFALCTMLRGSIKLVFGWLEALVFVDLKKAFDCVPKLIWWALRVLVVWLFVERKI